jgi:hypothetical protein
MPDRVNAGIYAMEPSSLDPRCHLIRRQATCSELVAGKNAPILSGLVGNTLIGAKGSSLDLFGHTPNNSRVGVLYLPMLGVGHAGRVSSVP